MTVKCKNYGCGYHDHGAELCRKQVIMIVNLNGMPVCSNLRSEANVTKEEKEGYEVIYED